MKKRFLALLTGCIVAFSGMSAFAAAESIVINGTSVDIPADMGSIKEISDRTFVPVRFVSEYLGCNVSYNSIKVNDQLQEAITITDSANTSYLMLSGDNILYVLGTSENSRRITMDVNVFIDNTEDRAYIPVRFLADALGYDVGWDEETQTVSLTSK